MVVRDEYNRLHISTMLVVLIVMCGVTAATLLWMQL